MSLFQRRKFPDCQICEDIWHSFVDPDTAPEVNFGSFQTAVSSGCPRHSPLVEHFREYCSSARTGGIRDAETSEDVGWSPGSKGNSVQLTESISDLGLFWGLLLVSRDAVADHPGNGRILHSDWVDLDLLKQWKEMCMSSHGAKCENPMKIPATRPAWLIDTELQCIVPGDTNGDFVALSYRWGRDSGHRVNASTRKKLQEPHALRTPEASVYLSPIVRHAIYLTSFIGERFLWVDTLCITHGDNAAVTEQLGLMGAIYASAALTIVATDGDSQDGLLGLREISAPRDLVQRMIPFGEERITVSSTSTFSMYDGMEYSTRAWTFQEFRMSKRMILFNQRESHWQCQCSVWHEELILGVELDKYIDPRPSVLLAGFPDLGSLSNIITNYNERELTYDEDANSGIIGLLSVLCRTFTGGCLYGIPEMFFDRGLGWKPHWSHINLRRRVQSERARGERLPLSALPSWSWIGWQGLTFMSHGEASRINDRSPSIEETTPITQWYTGSSPSGSQLRKIRSTWFEDRDHYKNFTNPLPQGWTSHRIDAEDEQNAIGPRLWPDGCGGQVFKHYNMVGIENDGCDSWYYPFPVTNIEQSTPLFTPEQTPYLFCKTNKCRLWGFQTGDYNVVDLCTASGDRVGSLHLHNQDQLDLFPQKQADDTPGLMVDLVAIYRSKTYHLSWDKEQERYTLPQWTSENYTVLWVEWKEDVAYRLASGSVKKARWEELDLLEVDLVLG